MPHAPRAGRPHANARVDAAPLSIADLEKMLKALDRRRAELRADLADRPAPRMVEQALAAHMSLEREDAQLLAERGRIVTELHKRWPGRV